MQNTQQVTAFAEALVYKRAFLALDARKYDAECTELFLAHKGLQHLHGFESFPNLRALWINDNELAVLDNLTKSFRLESLYAQNNKICTLKGSLKYLKSLKVLDLGGNYICDVHQVQKALSVLDQLETLNLAGNPCCEEIGYRSMIIYSMPSLRLLDCYVISEAERNKVILLKFKLAVNLATATLHIKH